MIQICLLIAIAGAGSLVNTTAPSSRPAVVHEVCRDENGKVCYETWLKGEKRFESQRGQWVNRTGGYDGKTYWDVYPDYRYVTTTSARPDTHLNHPVQSLDAQLKQLKASPYTKKLRLTHGRLYGRDVIELIEDNLIRGPGISGNGRERNLHFYDPKTRLPLEEQNFTPVNNKWQLSDTTVTEYPPSVPDSKFQLNVPTGFRVINEDDFLNHLDMYIHESIGTQEVAGQAVTLRHVFANEDGTMSVLWTGGALLGDHAKVTITDAAGVPHHGFGPSGEFSEFYALNYAIGAPSMPDNRLRIDGAPHLQQQVFVGRRPKLPFIVRVPVCATASADARDSKVVGYAQFVVQDIAWHTWDGGIELGKRLYTGDSLKARAKWRNDQWTLHLPPSGKRQS